MKKYALLGSLSIPVVFLLIMFSAERWMRPALAQSTLGCLDLPNCSEPQASEMSEAKQSAPWVFEPVDVPKSFLIYNHRWMVVDDSGNPHLAYGGDHLIYATHDGDKWVQQIVDDGASVGGAATLALDSSGRPHIAYVDGNLEQVKYATWTGDHWRIQYVADTNNSAYGFGLAIALDSADTPGIAYFETFQVDGLHLARPDGDDWVTQRVDDGGNLWDPSLVFDTADRPLIAYAERSNGHIKLAKWTGTTWDHQTVYSVQDSWEQDIFEPSLVVDQTDIPQIAFVMMDDRNYGGQKFLEYAHWDNNAWSVKEISPTNSYGVSMRLDSQNRPHILTSDFYLMKDSQGWVTETLEIGPYPTIGLDLADQPSISYYGRDPLLDLGGIFYGHLDGDDWSTELVDHQDQRDVSDRNVDVAITDDQRVHVSYFNDASRQLMHAQQTSLTWQIDAVAPAYYEATSSLALDSQGQPSVAFHSYHDGYKVDLARWTGTGWLTETVDVASTDDPIILQLDSQDRPHLGYMTDSLTHTFWNGASWEKRLLELYNPGEFWMALDSQDRAHFAYRAEDQNTHKPVFRHAYWDGGKWQTETILLGTNIYFFKLALDQDDNPHVIYHDSIDADMMHAVNDGDGWLFETIDRIYDQVEIDISFDGQGRPHVIYYSLYLSYIYYANRLAEGWQVQTVSKTKSPSAALTVDQYDRPIIAHYNSPGGGIYLAKGPDLLNKIYLPVILR